MAKRMYRIKDFKQLDWERLRDQASTDRVNFAVDVAKHNFVAQLEDARGERLALMKWVHPKETRALLDQLFQHFEPSRIDLVLEPTGSYGDVLRWQFEQAGCDVYRVNAKHVKDASEHYDGVPSSHDAKAAAVIAKLHRDRSSRRWKWNADVRRDDISQLKMLQYCQERHHRASSRLEARLARSWPELETVMGRESVTALKLLARFAEPAAVWANRDEARLLMRETARGMFDEEKCERLLISARDSLGAPCRALEREDIRWLAEEALAMHHEMLDREAEIRAQQKEDPVLAPLAAQVGPVTAVGLRAAVGDPADYDNARSFLKAIGLNLKIRSSGKHVGKLRLTKRGPGVARHFLYFAVLRWIQQDARAKQWYDAKIQRDGGVKKRALIALMRKLARGLWASCRNRKPFDSRLLFSLPA